MLSRQRNAPSEIVGELGINSITHPIKLKLVYLEKIYRVATVAGVEILRQRQLKDSVPDLRWVSAESFLPGC
ncbi:hypothetical protein IQ277_18885 [Nostocales cyanobacterium LEGE 12452]|nr:hypothetical protein [Nostocales cyanobacterium LEGE 12452]